MVQGPQTIYWLDDRDRIIKLNSGWERFAKDNQGNHLNAATVCGRTLHSFITGDTTRAWMAALLNRARMEQGEVRASYCCDSPEERREMSMRIVPVENNGMRVEHEVVRTEFIGKPVIFEYAPDCPPGFTLRCSICCEIKHRELWTHPAVAAKARANHSAVVKVIYVVCPGCLGRLPGNASAPLLSRLGQRSLRIA